MMRKLMVIALLGLALLAFTAMIVTAQEAKEEAKEEVKEEAKVEAKKECAEATHDFVGTKKCAGMCHKAQLAAWQETGHAKVDVLSAEDKAKPECGGACHMTGKLADGTVLEGVQCEACHGPGKAYKSPKIMSKSKWPKDPETYKKMAIDAGLVYPTEETCVGCHKEEGNPNFKAFDFEKSKGTVHAVGE